MAKYKIEMELLSETIFGSGYSVPGSVDLDIVHDEYGFPYMKAKTFKGNLREQIKEVIEIFKEKYNKDFNKELNLLIGLENNGLNAWKNIKISDCLISESIRNFLVYGLENGEINAKEILDSLTDTRSFTAIEEDGSYKKGSLRQIRVIRKGLKFYSNIYCERELEKLELSILAMGTRSLRHIGTMRTRGKGEVNLRLLVSENGEFIDKTDFYIDKLMEEVKKSV